VLRLVKYFLQDNPNSLANEVCAYVSNFRPDEDPNVLSILYKYSKPGRGLLKLGDRGSYRYSLQREDSD